MFFLQPECRESLEKISGNKKRDGKPCSWDCIGGADTVKMDRNEIAVAIERLGYSVSATEVQQYETDEALFHLIKTRGIINRYNCSNGCKTGQQLD